MVVNMNDEQIRISAKNLGSFAIPNCCNRCLWLKLRLQFSLPYQTFHGVSSPINPYTKAIVLTHFERFGKLPGWFSEFGEFNAVVPVPHYSKFFIVDEETNIKLTGTPDQILLRKDNGYSIINYESTEFTSAKDALLPVYKVRLNAYAMIAESIGLKPVRQIGLIHYRPQTDIIDTTICELGRLVSYDNFLMGFGSHCLQIELKPGEVVKPLLKKVRALWEMDEAPKGMNNCEDCGKLYNLITLLGRRQESDISFAH
jgi:hypothetical protein